MDPYDTLVGIVAVGTGLWSLAMVLWVNYQSLRAHSGHAGARRAHPHLSVAAVLH
jgi:hypothetical protein